MNKFVITLMFGWLIIINTDVLVFSQSKSIINIEVNKIITNYTIVQETYKLEEAIHIDCGINDKIYSLGGNSEDIGRIHFDRTYVQAADKEGLNPENRYFYYYFLVTNLQDCVIRFSDADNANRYYNVIINDEYNFVINHLAETSEDQPGGWKDYYIKIPQKALKVGKNKIMFDHRKMQENSPAISDIWIYKIINQ